MNCRERKEAFMEKKKKKACLDAFETGGELVLTQEETAETIVPDYCPDIARIIASSGKVYIHSRELRDGRAEVSGGYSQLARALNMGRASLYRSLEALEAEGRIRREGRTIYLVQTEKEF